MSDRLSGKSQHQTPNVSTSCIFFPPSIFHVISHKQIQEGIVAAVQASEAESKAWCDGMCVAAAGATNAVS